MNIDNFVLAIDKNRKLIILYKKKYSNFTILDELENRLEALLVTVLEGGKVSLSLKAKFVEDYEINYLIRKADTPLDEFVAGDTLSLELLADELGSFSATIIEFLKLLKPFFSNIKNSQINNGDWDQLCNRDSLKSTYYQLNLTLDSIKNTFDFLILNDYI